MRQSAEARLHSRMLLGLCNEGFLATATIMARLLRNAKVAKDPLTTARRASLMYAAVSFLAIPIQLCNPQIEPFSVVVILSAYESETISVAWKFEMFKKYELEISTDRLMVLRPCHLSGINYNI